MKLSFSNRMVIVNTLPQKGSIDKLTLAKDIEEKMMPNSAEIEEAKKTIDLKVQENGAMAWNPTKDKALTKEFAFTNAEIELVRSQFTELSNSNELPKGSLEACLLFKNYEEPKKEPNKESK